jgi:hypothetical protein
MRAKFHYHEIKYYTTENFQVFKTFNLRRKLFVIYHPEYGEEIVNENIRIRNSKRVVGTIFQM